MELPWYIWLTIAFGIIMSLSAAGYGGVKLYQNCWPSAAPGDISNEQMTQINNEFYQLTRVTSVPELSANPGAEVSIQKSVRVPTSGADELNQMPDDKLLERVAKLKVDTDSASATQRDQQKDEGFADDAACLVEVPASQPSGTASSAFAQKLAITEYRQDTSNPDYEYIMSYDTVIGRYDKINQRLVLESGIRIDQLEIQGRIGDSINRIKVWEKSDDGCAVKEISCDVDGFAQLHEVDAKPKIRDLKLSETDNHQGIFREIRQAAGLLSTQVDTPELDGRYYHHKLVAYERTDEKGQTQRVDIPPTMTWKDLRSVIYKEYGVKPPA